jgi:hypothetical protein
MKRLASRIQQELQVGEWKHCAVYENELKRLWPPNEKDREAKIAQFAREYGFRLRFYREGLCAIFDEWPRQTALADGRQTIGSNVCARCLPNDQSLFALLQAKWRA